MAISGANGMEEAGRGRRDRAVVRRLVVNNRRAPVGVERARVPSIVTVTSAGPSHAVKPQMFSP
jgi:hypothetical protein